MRIRQDTETVIDKEDNVFVMSNRKTRYPTLQLDLRLIKDLLVIIVSATGGGIIFSCLGQPVIVGYLLASSLIGPGGLNLISEMVQVWRLIWVFSPELASPLSGYTIGADGSFWCILDEEAPAFATDESQFSWIVSKDNSTSTGLLQEEKQGGPTEGRGGSLASCSMMQEPGIKLLIPEDSMQRSDISLGSVCDEIMVDLSM